MISELKAFRSVDFNWTHDLQSVWSDPNSQVDDLHRQLIDSVLDDFFLQTKTESSNPIGKVILGEAGAGKTHLIGTLRRRVWEGNGWFVLLDIVGITDFWETAALGFLNSLNQPMPDGRPQFHAILTAILKRTVLDASTSDAVTRWQEKPEKMSFYF